MSEASFDPALDPDEIKIPKDRETLRMGFTTGTAATAAALAAARILLRQAAPAEVMLRLPGGDDFSVKIKEGSLINLDEAMAVVTKDAGDDPDATNGADIGAIVRRRSEPGLLHILGGHGVGKITKPGLALPPGQWAINPGPRGMLKENLGPLLGTAELPGLEVEIFVERGEALAAATLNPRLGIIGGISILGSTGLVKPFSNEAYLATIESALNQARALGLSEIVFTTGRQSEKLIMAQRPDLPEESFVQIADFFGDSLKMAADRNFSSIGLAVFFGKAVKQAAGHHNTHAHKNDQDPIGLAQWLADSVSPEVAAELRQAMTARAALEILRAAGQLRLTDVIADRSLAVARSFAGEGPKVWMKIFDYNGDLLSDR